MSISLVTRMKIFLGGYKLAKKQRTLKTYSDMVKSIEDGTANKPIEEKDAKGLVDYLQKMELKAARKQLATAKAMAKMPYDWGLDEEKYYRACLNAAKKNGLDSREYEKARDAYKKYADGIAGNFRETRTKIAENMKTIDSKLKEAGAYALLAFDVASRLSTLSGATHGAAGPVASEVFRCSRVMFDVGRITNGMKSSFKKMKQNSKTAFNEVDDIELYHKNLAVETWDGTLDKQIAKKLGLKT